MNREFKYRNSETAYVVMAKAIKRHFENKYDNKEIEEKYLPPLMNIIADGFLYEIIGEQENMIVHNNYIKTTLLNQIGEKNRILANLESKQKEIQEFISDSDARIEKNKSEIEETEKYIETLKKTVDELENKLREYDGVVTAGTTETDPALAGAMKAHDFILKSTGDQKQASKAFNSYLLNGKFTKGTTYENGVKKFDAEKAIEEAKGEKLLRNISTMDLSTRTYNALSRNGIATIGEVVKLTRTELEQLRGMGEKGAKEIEEKLSKLHLALKFDLMDLYK